MVILKIDLKTSSLAKIGQVLGSQTSIILPMNLVTFFYGVTTQQFENRKITILSKNCDHSAILVDLVDRSPHWPHLLLYGFKVAWRDTG
jgi:hypothetical protein